MEKIEISAKQRSKLSPENIRKEGFVPAVVYGHGKQTEEIEVAYREFERAFKKAGESTIVTLNVEGDKPRNVIIKEVQKHYLNSNFLHVDFYEVSMTEKMTATVPLEFTGVSKAVKENSGVLVPVLNEVEVECLPADLPQHIEVDISALQTFEDVIRVSDLKVSDKVKIMADAEEAVVKVNPPRDVEAELAAPIVEDVSAVEGTAETKPEAAAEPAEQKE